MLEVRVLIVPEVHGLDVEGRHDDLLVGQDGLQLVRLLGREDDAAPTEIHLDGPQVGSVDGGAGQDCDGRQVPQQWPLSGNY